jgi:VWFA-related protein
MKMKGLLSLGLLSVLFLGSRTSGNFVAAQEDPSHILVNVVLVQLNVAVTDRKGHYVTGLRPENFQVLEDKIPERIATFEEGNGPVVKVNNAPPPANSLVAQSNHADPSAGTTAMKFTDSAISGAPVSSLAGANVFILFDTSNYMYRGFVFAQDAIANFIRSLEGVDKVAFYSYSRDLSRSTMLTSDRGAIMQGVRSTVAGDDAALYNSLLLTVKDTVPLRGRKAIVVFSNGPDNASSVPPEDVAELAQSTGTIIYMVSTAQAQNDPVSTAVFERMSKATGGKAYFARNWEDEKRAFGSIREDLAHLYSISYYPQPNSNRGWRSISVKLVGKGMDKYRVRTRDGYRLRQQVQ